MVGTIYEILRHFFRVAFCLCVKATLIVNLFIQGSFFVANETHFQMSHPQTYM